MINTQYINLSMIPSGVMPVLYCSQYDVGRPLGMVVYNGGDSVDLDRYTCTIEATRTDGTAITAAVTTDGNVGAFSTTATMTNQADKYPAKMVIVDGDGNKVASLAFILMVTPATKDENAESIEEDKSLYQQYTGTVQTLIADIRSKLSDEISARQTAVSTLQSDINAEAAKRGTADTSLQSQIDQLVAPSGTAPSEAEIENARVGADGVTYPTLGDAIRTQVGGVKSAILNSFISTEYASFTFAQGTISTLSGINLDATNRVRFTNINRIRSIAAPYVSVSVKAGYKASARFYSSFYLADYVGTTDWYSGDFGLTIPDGAVGIRIVIANDNDGDITPADVPADVIKLTYYQPTDKSVSIENKAADAKATGERIDESKLIAESALKMQKVTNINVKKFIQGSINYETGMNATDSTRVRSAGYMQFRSTPIVKVTVKPGYKVAGRMYTGNPIAPPEEIRDAYAGYLPTGESARFVTGEWYFVPNDEYYYRFVLAYEDDSAITPQDVENEDALIIEYYTLKESQDEEAISTLLGNVSIRAAKVYNFSDGTPPVVGWYLLQDIENNFYKSMDLKTMSYLFTFEAPTSTVSNWSCGIDAYDNVIFVKDAAGYPSDGTRLDDTKRENPVYFLASEQYQTVRELDFGESFRPAGWLMNVGWCLLPNKDIVFCEYTRGTLATCNVWHISGNIADPANWHKVWSHPIVDSTGPTEPEMKHCHCVQYDFYTGICYFSTGDGSNGSFIYHSFDNGATWELTYGPNRDRCRQLSFAFTKDYVYWASDSYEQADKHFFIAQRDQDGVIDVENAQSIELTAYNSQACYGCVYMQALDLILMMDRVDNASTLPLILKAYDLSASEVVTVATINPIGESHPGFRSKYIEWYPTGNCVPIGFNPRTGGVTYDTNANALCGSVGVTGNGSERVNNLLMHVYRLPNGEIRTRFGTIPLK